MLTLRVRSGSPVTRLDLLLTSLIVLAIVVGLQAVGVVLDEFSRRAGSGGAPVDQFA